MTYPENLQEIVDEAFYEVPLDNPARLNIAKRILSAVGFTEPKPPFQLPPPPPGMKWHREDGWTEGMLPQGWRPLVLMEPWEKGDQIVCSPCDSIWHIAGSSSIDALGAPSRPTTSCCRTQRPLKFTHKGHEWTWHRAGDPMPCDKDKMVEILMPSEVHETCQFDPHKLSNIDWNMKGQFAVIGWRYSDKPKSELESIKEEVKNLVQRIKKLEYGEG